MYPKVCCSCDEIGSTYERKHLRDQKMKFFQMNKILSLWLAGKEFLSENPNECGDKLRSIMLEWVSDDQLPQHTASYLHMLGSRNTLLRKVAWFMTRREGRRSSSIRQQVIHYKMIFESVEDELNNTRGCSVRPLTTCTVRCGTWLVAQKCKGGMCFSLGTSPFIKAFMIQSSVLTGTLHRRRLFNI